MGNELGFETFSFSDNADFIFWTQKNSAIENRNSKMFCVVFDSGFVTLFNQPLPAWLCSTPRICISRSNKIAMTVNPVQLGLFDFMLKPFNINEMRSSIEKAFPGFDLKTGKLDSLESIVERIGQLTKRELEICYNLSQGLTGKQISHELGISVKTYYVHRTNLLQKNRGTVDHRADKVV